MNQNKTTLAFLWHYSWQYKWYTLGIIIATPLAILAHTFLSSLIISDILARLSSGDYTTDLMASFGTSIALFIGVYLIGNVALYRLLTFLMWRLDMLVRHKIAEDVFSHLMLLDARFHADNLGGTLVAQANKLTGAYERILYTTVYSAAPLLLTFVFTSIILLPRVPFYVGILLILASCYLAVALTSAKRIRHFNTAEARATSRQTGILADNITNIMTVKSFGHEYSEQNAFKKAVKESMSASSQLLSATLKRDTYFSLLGSMFSIGAVVMVIVSVLYLKADIATAFLMLTYSLAIARSLWDFSGKALRDYNRALGDAHDMIEILAIKPQVADPAKPLKPKAGKGTMEINSISFTHHEAKSALFRHFNLHIRAGEKVGLVGRSGSGKTTLTKLLLRFADVDDGEIRINDQPINSISQKALRDTIAYVPQEPLLFHRSIRENIAYGKPGASMAEIREASKQASALEFIEELPNGFDTLVGERGIKLSGGQRQRIAIARAILKNAPILVLDEATSALDSESEKAIQKALQKLMKGRTTVVVAHRLSTIASLDRIVVLDKGKVIEEGTHATLLNQSGTYAKLWQHQSSGFIEE